MTAPVITRDEALTRLKIAHETRRANAELWRRITSREVALSEALTAGDTWSRALGGRRLAHLLTQVPGWGTTKVTAVLTELGFAPERRWRSLGTTQKSAVIAAIKKGEQS